MTDTIPVSETTQTEDFLNKVAWDSRPAASDQVAIRPCPFCGNDKYKFYINRTTGLWDCKACTKSGNLFQLRSHVQSTGDSVSIKDVAQARSKSPLPDFIAASARLLGGHGDAVLDYLVATRKWSISIIAKLKLGCWEKGGKQWLVIPYFDAKGQPCYYKARTIPPEDKAFDSPAGYEAPIYNVGALNPGMDEVLLCEGEPDTIAMLSNGFENVVGIPGASSKKSTWVDLFDGLESKRLVILFDRDKPGQEGARALGSKLGLHKCYNAVLPEFFLPDGSPGKDVNDWFKAGRTADELRGIIADARKFDVAGVQHLSDVLGELSQDLEDRGTVPKYMTPWPSLTRKLGGFEDGDLLAILADAKIGKAQPLDAPVKTLTGWTEIGALEVGDDLASVDGGASVVTGVYDRGEQDVYRVEFSDGRSTLCSGDHLWKVQKVKNSWKDGPRVLSTTSILRMCDSEAMLSQHQESLYIPLCSGDFGVDGPELVLDPWLLGVLLGDGDLSHSCIAIHKLDRTLRARCEDILWSYGCSTSDIPSGFRIRKTLNGNGLNYVAIALGHLGLRRTDSYSKFIPACYMNASREVRAALLQGLLDTDGTIGKAYSVTYSTSSIALAENVQELVRSLGGVAAMRSRIPHYTYRGERKAGATSYTISVRGLGRKTLFSIPHKKERADKYATTARQTYLTIKQIVFVGREPVRCISVSHDSRLYLTDDYIVTHNTTLALNLLHYYAAVEGRTCFSLCLEMPTKRSVRKWVSLSTQTDDSPGASKMTPETINYALEIAAGLSGDILFGYSKDRDAKTIFDLMRQAVRRYGVSVLVFDHLHLLCRSVEHQAQEVARLAADFKALAMELGILVILIVQPNRVAEGQIVSARNILGSSMVEKMVDCLICLHRNRVGQIKEKDFQGIMETEAALEPYMLVKVELSRYSAGGATTLYMDGATSTVRELNEDQATAWLKPRPTGIPVEDSYGEDNL